MLQKTPSKKLNQLKYFLIVPLIALFLYAFNTKEIFKPIDNELFPNIGETIKIKKEPKFINPVYKENVTKISSGYGKQMNPFTNKKQFHKGVDIVSHKGTNVYATADGIVSKATYNTLKGNHIEIKHNNNYQTNYHHLGKIQIALGETVKSGEIISTVGNSGKSTGAHLHYEIVKKGENINPKNYINYNINTNPKISNKKTKKELNNLFDKEIIEFVVTKNATDLELKNIKKEFNKQDVKISFKKVKRNKKNEIISIKINATRKGSKVNYVNSNDNGINSISIKFEDNNISIGDNDAHSMHLKHKNLFVWADDKKHKNKHKKHTKIEIHSDDDSHGHDQNVFVYSDDDNKNTTYIVNDKKMTKEEFEKMDKKDIHTIRIESSDTLIGHGSSKSKKSIFITEDDDVIIDGDNQTTKKIKIVKHHNGDSNSFFYEIDNDDDDQNTVTTYIVNGKKMTKEEFKKMDKSKIRDLKINKESNIKINKKD
jgi:hypothetical protein